MQDRQREVRGAEDRARRQAVDAGRLVKPEALQRARDTTMVALSEAEVALRAAQQAAAKARVTLAAEVARFATSDPNDLTAEWTATRERCLAPRSRQ